MRTLTTGIFAALLPVGAYGEPFPEPYNSETDRTSAPPRAVEAVKRFVLPDGFRATVFAAEPEVRNPIAMAWDHRGRLWVAENFTYAESAKRFDLDLRDRVLVFEDADGDGQADSRVVFADDLQMLSSVELGRGGVWVLCPPELLFIPDRDGDDVPDGAAEVKLDGFTVAKGNHHNFANGLRWGPDGWLYGRCGHSCTGELGKPGTPEGARVPIKGGIWRYDPGRGVVEVVAHGTTNPWGHDWDAGGELFFINTVNGHLWHGITGAHFRESSGEDRNPEVFERLDTHADHWHFDTTGNWSASRDGKANAFGGGHAHIGMMIYQAEQWPEALRGRLYTLNLHGRRTNVERLERSGSGYVGRHQEDVFLMGDPWFRGIDIRQGPEGSAYVLDWSDTGECHDHSGVHRGSGRIYRIDHGEPALPDPGDLERLDPDAVRRLLKHPNVWFERQLRNRLAQAPDGSAAVLGEMLASESDPVTRLRALWALHALGAADPELLRNLLGDGDERLRVWAIRLLTDRLPMDTLMGRRPVADEPFLDDGDCARFTAMATSDGSGLVRLALASTLQRLPHARRAELGAALASRSEDADDHNLPSMVWYGLLPLGEADPMALVRVAESCRWPATLRWIARSLAGRTDGNAAPFDALLSLAAASNPTARAAILRGTVEAYKGRRSAPKPKAWDALVAALPDVPDPGLAAMVARLGTLFGDDRALGALEVLALDTNAGTEARRAALEALIEIRPSGLRRICEALLGEQPLVANALRGLALFDDPSLGEAVAARYGDFDPADRPAVIELLVSRPQWAATLLERLRDGSIPRAALAAFHARQIRAFGDRVLDAELAAVWGEARESPHEKRRLVEEWKTLLTPDALAAADLGHGRVLFHAACASCHVLYGHGGTLGPDLTGGGRADLGYLLENIADPSAVVAADYRMSTLALRDGRVVAGVVGSENARILTLRQIPGVLSLEKGEIVRRETSPQSMMPEGLLQSLPPDGIRDLIAYLRHPVQVPLPDAP